MTCNFAPKILPAALAALSCLCAGSAFGECIVVEPEQQVTVQVLDCRTFAEVAPEIREVYGQRFQRERGRDNLPSPDHLDLDSILRAQKGKVLRGRLISVQDAAGRWQRESAPRERLFVLAANLDCPEVPKSGVIEMGQAPACCDVGQTSTVACILESPVLDPPTPRATTPGGSPAM